FARTVLERHGYQVIEAESGEAALEELRGYQGRLDLLVTDVMLSGMDGCELAERILRDRSRVRVLLMSGYAEPAVTRSFTDLMEKPFTAHTLLSRVRGA